MFCSSFSPTLAEIQTGQRLVTVIRVCVSRRDLRMIWHIRTHRLAALGRQTGGPSVIRDRGQTTSDRGTQSRQLCFPLGRG